MDSLRYYSKRLSAARLQRCYDIAPPRVRQYLEAEIEHVLEKIHSGDRVLELGCGYGRLLARIASKAECAYGIDTASDSLEFGAKLLGRLSNCHFLQMDAVELAFANHIFDLTICIQNGISAFQVDPLALLRESVRTTKPGGTALFSSYCEQFWPSRMEWFQLQAEEGLLGDIDYSKTGSGVIVCKDGFRATTFRPADFRELAARLGCDATVVEVDESSLFCQIRV